MWYSSRASPSETRPCRGHGVHEHGAESSRTQRKAPSQRHGGRRCGAWAQPASASSPYLVIRWRLLRHGPGNYLPWGRRRRSGRGFRRSVGEPLQRLDGRIQTRARKRILGFVIRRRCRTRHDTVRRIFVGLLDNKKHHENLLRLRHVLATHRRREAGQGGEGSGAGRSVYAGEKGVEHTGRRVQGR